MYQTCFSGKYFTRKYTQNIRSMAVDLMVFRVIYTHSMEIELGGN